MGRGPCRIVQDGRAPTWHDRGVRVHEVFPYLRVRGAAAAIEFYTTVFEARERFRLIDPSDGRVGHAELELGPNMVLMLSDEYPEYGIHGVGPAGASMGVHLHVGDAIQASQAVGHGLGSRQSLEAEGLDEDAVQAVSRGQLRAGRQRRRAGDRQEEGE